MNVKIGKWQIIAAVAAISIAFAAAVALIFPNAIFQKERRSQCCITPPCTECYEDLGYCECDYLISQGKIPCSECATATSCN